MKKNRFKILTSYWFIGAVVLLLFNDFLFKDFFHNWLTGKLSDFVGLFFFPLFFTVFFPKRIKEILLATTLFFVYWKSPLSQNFIDFVNDLSSFHFSRIIDYSDLMALAVLPLSYYIFKKRDQLKSLKVYPIIPLLLSGFAMMATSQDRNYIDLSNNYPLQESQYNIYQDIITNPLDFQNEEANLHFNDTIIKDTMSFNVFLNSGTMNKSANVYGLLISLDSINSEIQLISADQTGGDCGFFRPRCKEGYDEETTITAVFETNIINKL